jgi:hypothetical protein
MNYALTLPVETTQGSDPEISSLLDVTMRNYPYLADWLFSIARLPRGERVMRLAGAAQVFKSNLCDPIAVEVLGELAEDAALLTRTLHTLRDRTVEFSATPSRETPLNRAASSVATRCEWRAASVR